MLKIYKSLKLIIHTGKQTNPIETRFFVIDFKY